MSEVFSGGQIFLDEEPCSRGSAHLKSPHESTPTKQILTVYRPRQAWQWMRQTLVMPADHDWVRGEVVDAWRRCFEDYPLRYPEALPSTMVCVNDWDHAVAGFDHVLLEAFRDMFRAASTQIGECELTLCLTDSRCRLIALQGQDLRPYPLGRHLGYPLADWSESVIGNNGIGSAAILSEPVAFSGEEHYLALLHPFTTAGYPLLDDKCRLLAVLGLVGDQHIDPGVLKALLTMFGRRLRDLWIRHQDSRGSPRGRPAHAPEDLSSPPLSAPAEEAMTTLAEATGTHSLGLVHRLLEKAVRLQERRIPILVVGESGAGKEFLVRQAYEAGPRRQGPFIAVNCASIPRDLIESELFGYAAGSFTGARKEGKVGKFLLADQGVLFLDEIGDMGLDLQAVLLRVLESSEFFPVGATKPVKVDVQIFAATNVPIQQAVREGRFRRDLYYRLNGAQLILPALREREDKQQIINQLFEREQQLFGRSAPIHIGSAVMELFLRHPWPGNIRQLSNVIRTSLYMAEGQEITPADLPDDFFEELKLGGGLDPQAIRVIQAREAKSIPEETPSNATTLADWEFQAIKLALETCKGNLTKTAKALGITRGTLYKKLDAYGLDARKTANK